MESGTLNPNFVSSSCPPICRSPMPLQGSKNGPKWERLAHCRFQRLATTEAQRGSGHTNFWGRWPVTLREEIECQRDFWKAEGSSGGFPMPGPLGSGGGGKRQVAVSHTID